MDAALEELADLAAYTLRERLRRACLSHLRCDVTAVGRIGVFVLALLAAMPVAYSAGGGVQIATARAARMDQQ